MREGEGREGGREGEWEGRREKVITFQAPLKISSSVLTHLNRCDAHRPYINL